MPTQTQRRGFGVFGQIGHSTRFYALMAFMVPVVLAGGMMSQIRNALAAQAFGGSSGVGLVALGGTLGGAAVGVFAGSIADRFRPKRIVVVACFMQGVTNGVLALLVMTDTLTGPVLVIMGALEGVVIAFSVTSLIKTQAALVPPGAKGAAESINGVRASIGSVVGVVLAGQYPIGAPAITFCSGLFVVAGLLVSTIGGPLVRQEPASSEPRARFADLFAAMKSDPALRAVIIADLVTTLAVPTTLLALAVVSEEIVHLGPLLAIVGILGVLAGRLSVTFRGTGGAVARDLMIACSTYAFLAILAVALLTNDWLLGQVPLMSVIAFIASACGSFMQGLLSAKVQDHMPDALRGRGSGMIYTLRAAQIAVGVAVATWVVGHWSLHEYMMVLSAGLLLVVVGLRGFRAVR